MDMILIGVLILFSFTLFIIGFFKKHVVLSTLSGIGFILSGVWFWSGVEYVSSTTVVQNLTGTTTITDNYSVWNSLVGGVSASSVVGTVFILFGLFLLFVSMSAVFAPKGKIDFDDSGDGDGG